MTGDHPRQIRVIASSGAKLRAEEEELMPVRGSNADANQTGTFQVENWRKARSMRDENVN